ncbi:propeptide, peptidase [Vibrio sp. 99-70-13A1]|nr:propeptide, peptidase [Vibrio sp. 99-70-13A1]
MIKSPLCVAILLASLPSVAAQWDYPQGNTLVANQQEAQTYLEQAYPSVGSLQFRYSNQSKLGHHYNFDVFENGVYQQQRTVILTTDNDHQVSRVFKSLEDTVIRNGLPTTAGELEVPRQLEAERPPTLASGQVVQAEVSIFSPDLRTMHRSAPPESLLTDISQYPHTPQYISKGVEVLSHTDGIYLTNSRVSQVDAVALVTVDQNTGETVSRDSQNFLPAEGVTTFASLAELKQLDWQDKRFTQVMAFVHLDQSLLYLNQLGFPLFDKPLEFDGRGLSADNSTYYYGPKAALFGIAGGSPDALDADVIIHELGHGIHYQIVKDWAYGHTGAIGEGFGDYWAGSFSFRTQFENAQTQGQEFEIDTVFNWDGYFGVRNTTRSLWNQRARYFQHAEYRPHESVAGELGDELWSTPLFQALKSSVELYGQDAFQEFDTIVLESMFGLGRGLKMHDLAENTVFVAQELYPERRYTEILKQKFAIHNLIIEPFNVEIASRYVHPEKSLTVDLYPTSRQAEVAGEIDIAGSTKAFTSQPVNQFSIETALPIGQVCGSSIAMNTSLDYQYNAALKKLSWQHQLDLIYGIPTLNSPLKEVNSPLPDSKLSSSNQPIIGFKTFNFTLNDSVQSVGEQFGVYLDIDHPRLADLTVTLISPRGTRVDLLKHQPTRTNGFNSFFTFKHDALLNAFANEPSNGTWRLEVGDYVMGESGHLNRWAVGMVSEYDCGDAAAKASSSSSSGGGSSPLILVLMLFLSLGRVINPKNLLCLTSFLGNTKSLFTKRSLKTHVLKMFFKNTIRR